MSIVNDIFNRLRNKKKGLAERYAEIIRTGTEGMEANAEEIAIIVKELGYSEAEVEADVRAVQDVLKEKEFADKAPERHARSQKARADFKAAEDNLKTAKERWESAHNAWQSYAHFDDGQSRLAAAMARAPRVFDPVGHVAKRAEQGERLVASV